NLPFDTIYEEDDSMDLGEEKVETEGIDGIGRKIKASIYKEGEEINNTNKEWIEVEKEPVNKVIKVGTKANKDNSTEEPGTNTNGSESEEPKENEEDKPKENEENKPSEKYDSDIVYIDGYENGMFKPDSNMTRAEVSKVLAYALTKGLDENKEYVSNFTDVNEDAWYAKILAYMEEIKVIDGYPGGEFNPDKPITRAEFAKIVSLIDGFEENDRDEFKDVKTNHWAKKYIEDLAKKGHVKGYPDGSYKPENNITRAEVVTIINRIIGKDKKFYENRKDLKLFKDVDKEHWAYMDIIMASNKNK
ncbi:MAG: S-layer homology domain-containing protein, partial [Andreesenia angusta]|nr:S-layer homology domain-containing protein [Andreesenia angusta]